MSPQEPQMDHARALSADLSLESTLDPNSLWYIHGGAYDLSSFILSHPGGPDALLVGRGRDCTALFESYHPFTDKPAAILPKYKVKVPSSVLSQRCIDMSQRNFFRLADGSTEPFWAALKQRCGHHMRTHNIPRTMSMPLFSVFLLIAAIQAALYVFGYLRGSYLAAMVLGASSWLLMTPGHEGIHYAVSRSPLMNKLIGYYSMFGLANPAMWEQQHNYGHHTFTNDYQLDPDLRAFANVLRIHRDSWHRPRHRLQYYDMYVYFCLTLTLVGECLKFPFQALLRGSVMENTSLASAPRSLKLFLAGHLAAFIGLLFVLPRYVPEWFGNTSPYGMGFTYIFTAGALFGHFATVSHLSELSMVSAEKNTSWAQQQVETAANFNLDSLFWACVSGGAAVQIEHHLFPGLSVEALMELSPLVRQTCADFNVAYKSFNGYFDLLQDLLIYLKPLAAKPPATPQPPPQKAAPKNSGKNRGALKLEGKEARLAPETAEKISLTGPIVPVG